MMSFPAICLLIACAGLAMAWAADFIVHLASVVRARRK